MARLLGTRAAERLSAAETTPAKNAFDVYYPRADIRVTFAPCRRGRCVVAVSTTSPRYRTKSGLHVGDTGFKFFVATGNLPGLCGPWQKQGSRANYFCAVGYGLGPHGSGPRTGTTELEHLPDRLGPSSIITLAVAEPDTYWNIYPRQKR